jgi:hypothetical protein
MSIIETRSLLKGAGILLISLAWNEAAKQCINKVFPMKSIDNVKGPIPVSMLFWPTIIYAIFVTIMIICIIEMYNYGICKIEGVNRFNNSKLSVPLVPNQ